MKSLARFSSRRRWLVLTAWIALFIVINIISAAKGSAYANNFTLPSTNSSHALALLAKYDPNQKGDVDEIVFHSTSGAFTSAQETAANAALLKISHDPSVGEVISPFNTGSNGLIANPMQDGKDNIAYAEVVFKDLAFNLKTSDLQHIENVARTAQTSAFQVEFGGNGFGQLDTPAGSPGEVFGLIATAVVLVLAFGSFFAMLLPLGIALFALGIASAATSLLSHGLSIAMFAPILGSLIGLGVGIDYALFIVTRARQNLKQGMTVEDSVITAINTSGRAVLFAGSTVVIALLGMLVLGFSFLNGVAIASALTVVITMTASLTLLPALLTFQKFRVLSRKERRSLKENGPEGAVVEGSWFRWSNFVSRRPKSLALSAIAIMAIVTVPVFSLFLGSSDQGSDPAGSTTRMAYDYLAQGFGPGFNGPLLVVGELQNAADRTAMQTLDQSLQGKPGIASVSPLDVPQSGAIGIIQVIPTTSPQAKQTNQLITTLRNEYIPAAAKGTGAQIFVGGQSAISMDFASILDAKIPLFLGVIVFLGCLLLMIAFRSVLIPLVAALMNLLAVAASFGLVVAVFQWGWGSSLIHAGTGPVEDFLPIIMIAILFGLSMDYQVFLVSRMHEEWTNSGDNERAIARGQANTGRVITAAALIMICVFFSFAFGGQRVIAEFGIGLGGAVLMDAFIIRTVLVPSLMHFFGKANWWMPKWLDRIIPHLAVEANE
jgi:putative drug exporter of the RND superfamily